MIHPHSLISELTVEEFVELQKKIMKKILKYSDPNEYGIAGLAKILGCSKSTAGRIKSTGILDSAISQTGRTIVIDKEKVLKILQESKELNKELSNK